MDLEKELTCSVSLIPGTRSGGEGHRELPADGLQLVADVFAPGLRATV